MKVQSFIRRTATGSPQAARTSASDMPGLTEPPVAWAGAAAAAGAVSWLTAMFPDASALEIST